MWLAVAEARASLVIAKSLGSRFILATRWKTCELHMRTALAVSLLKLFQVSMNSQMANEFLPVMDSEGMLQSGWQVLGSEAVVPHLSREGDISP